jgi:hypothetical protein
VAAVPVAAQPGVESAPEIPEDTSPEAAIEEVADEIVEGEEAGTLAGDGVSEGQEDTGENAPPADPAAEFETEPADEPPDEVEAEPAPLPARGSRRVVLVLAVLLTVLGAGWYFFSRGGGGAGVGGGAPTGGVPEVVLESDLGPRAAVCPDGKGGAWWYGFKLAHYPPPGRPGVYELQANLFSRTAVDDAIRLTFTENAGRLSVVSLPSGQSATLPGPADQPQQFLVKVTATPAGPGLFNLDLHLWQNPNPAAAGQVALPLRLGARFQKNPTTVPTTTRVDPPRIAREPQEALK